jgi:predicted dehydrogenase
VAPIRVGVLGTGRWSRRAHLAAWRRDKRVQLAGLYDIDADRSAEASAACGGVRVYSSATELIESSWRCLSERRHQPGPVGPDHPIG